MKMITIEDFGNIYSCYLAYSSDENIRFSASSGGFCKSFLSYLIESALEIDEAIITRTGSSSNPLIPEVITTSSKNDIISTRTNSVYAPTNPIPLLKDLNQDKKYVFTGLGCHVRNLRLLQKKGIAKNVKIVIGILCHHTPNIDFAKEILKKLNVSEKDVVQIEYRGSGWPGGFTAHLKNGGKKFIPLLQYWSEGLDNGPEICKHCAEICKDADLVVCDPWKIMSPEEDSKGKTLVICRNEGSDKLIKTAEKKGYLILDKCTSEKLFISQREHVNHKFMRVN